MAYETILVDIADGVALITLNRPQALNALNKQMRADLIAAFDALEPDPKIGCFAITGSARAFAAGADIKEMADKTTEDMARDDFFAGWERIANCKKPVIAAVGGFALGGGCEIALMCDFIIAADTAKFGQPEIKIGVIPAIGGSQRLIRAIGKAKAMDMCLTGRMMDAAEAERSGLVARVVSADKLIEEALSAAKIIAGYSQLAVAACKDAVNQALEVSLSDGVRIERRLVHALFATADQKEGMAAFIEKRDPQFKNR